MKRFLLYSLFTFFSFTFLSAQICEPDMTYADSAFGVYPPSITESACINQGYYFQLTFVIPETVDFNGVVVTVVKINLDSVSGLPVGLAYSTNPADGEFVPSEGLACANIYGVATEVNAPGEYELILNGTITLAVFGSVPLATLFQALGLENYKLILEAENSGTCFVTSIEEPLNEQIRIETAPNPFSTETTISITSEINESLELKVYTMLGQLVHSENIQLGFGSNNIPFDGAQLAEGVYFFQFSDGNNSLTQKMIIQR
jgi:Secretion system C-terminal sorting domain